jgi:hypothetical protein
MPSITVQASAPAVTTVAGTVAISSLPAISGTVTANAFGQDYQGIKIQIPVETDSNGISDKFIPIGYNDDGDARQVSFYYPLPSQVYGADLSNASQKIATAQIGNDLTTGYRLAVGLANNNGFEFGTSYNNPILAGGYSSVCGTNKAFAVTTLGYQVVTISNSSLNISGSVTVGNSVTIGSLPAISGTVTIGNSVTIGSLPAISGTVTASVTNNITVGSLPVQLSTTTIGGTARLNVTLSSATAVGTTAPSYGNLYGGSDGTNLRAILVDSSGRTTVTGSVSILGTPSVTFSQIAGAVTMCGLNVNGGISILSASDINESPDGRSGNTLLVKIMDNVGSQNVPLTNTTLRATAVTIAGTVTANNPNGTLTTRFGSVTTGGTSQLTACVTNSARKYLFCQNISTATVTIGIGFSPTTTQGIQLTAGGGITFDAFCPTGGVWWLGATNANFTILEG